ncbi:hypothetical protein [Streptomyces sp. NPDC003697]
MRALQKVVITAATVGGLVALGAGSAYAADHNESRYGRTQSSLTRSLGQEELLAAVNQALGVGEVNQGNQAVGTDGRVNQVNQAIGTTGRANQANQAIGTGR